MGHVNALAGDIGTRPSATEPEIEAANYIEDRLESFGYTTSLQEFPIAGFSDNTGAITLADGTDVPALPLTNSITGEVDGPLTDGGVGQRDDLGLDAAGSVALVERGVLPFGQIVQNAADAGVIAVIIYNNEPGNFRGELSSGGLIPAVSISQEDGSVMMLEVGANVSVSVQSETVTGTAHNVIGKATDGDCTLVIGGHYDSVPDGPGANDNASGTAVAIELARTLAADGLDAGLCVVLFSGEERGLLGSIHYVAQLTPDEVNAMRGFLNFDMLGVGEGWPIIGTQDLSDLAVAEGAALGITLAPSDLPPNVGSDHAPFIDAGISAVLFNCFCDENYHTILDRPEFVKEVRLQQAGDIGLAMAKRLLAE